MFSKSIFVFAFLAVSKLVVAQPPACLLAAVNTQENPSDLSKVCGNASDVQMKIMDACKSNAEEALKAFQDTCKSAGVTVSAMPTPSSSASVSASVSASASASASSGKVTGSSTVVFKSTFVDEQCSCTKTTAVSTVVPVTAGIATATPSGTKGTGTSGSPSASPSGSGLPNSNGATGNIDTGSFAVVAVAAAGLVAML